MNIRDFALERFFAEHEFAAKHVLAASDVEGIAMSDVVALADPECRSLWDNLRLGYTESAGLPLLRAEIAALYPGLTPDDVLVFAGAEEGVFLAMNAMLSPGDHIVVVWPAYQSLHEVARSIGASVTHVPLNPIDWSLDVDAVARALTPATKMVVINFPHSPTGAHIDRDQLNALVQLCEDRGIWLFSDEVYRFLEHEASAQLPPVAILSERGISLGVMSKAFGLAGVRIGWIATRDRDVRARIAVLKDYTTICNSAPSEILSLIGLRAKQSLVDRALGILHANLPILAAFMERHAEHLTWTPPQAGSVCFPRFRAPVDAEVAARFLIERVGVVILPGARFQFDPSHFRVGLGRTDMAVALDLIDPLIAELGSAIGPA